MTPWVRITLACTVFVALLAARDATAGAPTDQLRTQVDKVLKLLDDAGLKAPDKAKERRVELSNAIQQDHPDLLVRGPREEDEDAPGRARLGGEPAARVTPRP